MHGGPLEPSVHLFSFRDLVQRKRKNKGQREFMHQVGAAPREKIARDLVQRKRKNKGQREFVHQVGPALGQRPVTSPKAPPSPGGLTLRPTALPAARRQPPSTGISKYSYEYFYFFPNNYKIYEIESIFCCA